MRLTRLVALGSLIALGACNQPQPPGGFGVNLTIDARGIDASVRGQIAAATLYVTGDDPSPFSSPLDIVAQLKSGQARFRYDPKVHTGTLTMHVDAVDGSGAVITSGDSGPIALTDGKTANAKIALGAAMPLDLGLNADGGVDAAVDLAGRDLTAPPDLNRPKNPGDSCQSGAECASGHCADQVCCDSACDDACHACNLTGFAGTCKPIGAGSAPATGHPTCGPDPIAGCQRDGTCDGNGACRLYQSGTLCGSPSCSAGTLTPASTCDGKGTCTPTPSRTCAPYVCKDGQSCFTSCTGNTQCAGSNACVNSSCGPKQNGAGCMAGSECMSGNCVQQTCCDKPCNTTCMSCTLGGAKTGYCNPVLPNNPDPLGGCAKGSGVDATCAPGGCDGTGKCLNAASGTACVSASCTSGAETFPASCNGTGKCAVPSPASQACTPYICGPSACKTGCSADSDCVSGDYCSGTTCVTKLGPGGSCGTSNDKCMSNTCVDGVCCSTACSNADSCANGMLTTYSCATPTAGTCTPSTSSCGAYTCASATACKTSCTADGDCASGNYCNSAGSCVPKGSGSCTADDQCVTNHCSPEKVCCDTACTGQCEACNITGKLGTCSPVTGPPATGHTGCMTDGSAACVGSCNGTNRTACTYPDNTVLCRAAFCNTNPPNIGTTGYIATGNAYCSNGSCPTGAQTNCVAYNCLASSPAYCYVNCTTDAQCFAADSCINGACKLSLGP